MRLVNGGFASTTFDYVRFFAALAVLFGHGVIRFFGPYDPTNNNGYLEKAFRVLFSGYGSHGVTVFFVLSGFFIGASVLNQFKQNRFHFRDYFFKRYIRLSIVLIPGLALGYLLDSLGLVWFSEDAIYSGGKIMGSITSDGVSLPILAGNLMYTQSILVPTLGTNGALWSLSNEFWYYMLFPFLVWIFASNTEFLQRILASIVFVGISLCVGGSIMLLFPIWLTGLVLVYSGESVKANTKHTRWLWLSGLLFLATLLMVRLLPSFEYKFIERAIVTVPFVVFCIAILRADRPIKPPAKNTFFSAESLAGFSYTLYVIHTPLLCFMRGWLINGDEVWQVTPSSILAFFTIVLGIIITAFGLAQVTEKHTHTLYKKFNLR